MGYAVYSDTQGPDGNGLLSPYDPAMGGNSGSANTPAASAAAVLASGGFVPTDLAITEVEAVVVVRTPQAGTPTAGGSMRIKGTFLRNGNTLSQQGGAGQTIGAELALALGLISARFVVDATKTPNQIAVQVQPNLLSPPLGWRWTSGTPTAL